MPASGERGAQLGGRAVDRLARCGEDAEHLEERVDLAVEAPLDDVLLAATAKCIADARVSPEGREGIGAFLEKRAPSGVPTK